MTTIRIGRRQRFTTVPRDTVNDKRLSYRARGVLLWLLDKPDDWHTNADQIAQAGTEGRDAVRAALKELELTGYLERQKYRKPSGAWTSDVTVHEVAPERVSSAGEPLRSTSAGDPTLDSQALSTSKTVTNTVLGRKAFKHGQSVAGTTRSDAQDVADGYRSDDEREAFMLGWQSGQELRSEGATS